MLKEILTDISLEEVVTARDFRGATIISVCLSALLLTWPPNTGQQVSYLAAVFVAYAGVGGAIFSVAIATYAIFTGLTEPNFLLFMRRAGALRGYLGAFAITSLASIVAAGVALICLVLTLVTVVWQAPVQWKMVMHFFPLWLVAYAILSSAELIVVITDYIKLRGRFYTETLGMTDDQLVQYLKGMHDHEAHHDHAPTP